MAAGTDFQILLQAIEAYYGSGSDQWAQIFQYGMNAENAYEILAQTPGVSTIVSESGNVLGYTIDKSITSNVITQAEQIGNAINSNTQLSTAVNSANVNIPSHMEIIDVDSTVIAQSGSLSSAGTVVKTVGKAVANTVVIASVSATLGKTIDSVLYNISPEFWDSHNMSELNPETWSKITEGKTGIGANVFNWLFGIKDNGEGQAYLSEDAFAYIAAYMNQQGALQGIVNADKPNPAIELLPGLTNHVVCSTGRTSAMRRDGDIVSYWGIGTQPVYSFIMATPSVPGGYIAGLCSKENFTAYSSGAYTINQPRLVNIGGESFYSIGLQPSQIGGDNYIIPGQAGVMYSDTARSEYGNYYDQIGYIIMSGIRGYKYPGITDQENAVLPILPPNTNDIETIKQALKEQYPELWQDAITNDIIQPDGTIKTVTSIPVTTPDTDANGNPITGQSNQSTPGIDPNTSPDSQQQSAFDNFTNPPTDPTTGTGQTPPPILPTGSASSLWAIYNPTQGQLNQFGAWLWSDNFIDQIKKLFNDPMQAIIGVHKIFVTPPTGGSATIVCGYLDSGVPSRTVSSQYTTVSCGSVSLREYFGNVFDYNPYTEVSIYLPFIGIQRLDVDDVMRATISVEYTVDVLTGACQAKVNVMRDSAGGTIYCYSGNCSVTYPISSGSYMGVVSAIASVAGTLVSAVATGGATAPLAVGAVSGLMHAKTNVQHSGSLSGNAGACGIKKPYLIISRPQTAMPAAYETIEGTSTNYTVKLGTCSGYTRVKEMHVDGVTCTASELADIERLLKEGVIL